MPQLQGGSAGQFDVMVDGELLVGKRSVGIFRRLLGESGFPDPDAVIEALRQKMPPPPDG